MSQSFFHTNNFVFWTKISNCFKVFFKQIKIFSERKSVIVSKFFYTKNYERNSVIFSKKHLNKLLCFLDENQYLSQSFFIRRILFSEQQISNCLTVFVTRWIMFSERKSVTVSKFFYTNNYVFWAKISNCLKVFFTQIIVFWTKISNCFKVLFYTNSYVFRTKISNCLKAFLHK